RVGLFVGKSVCAPNDSAGEAHLLHVRLFVELDKDGMGQTIDPGLQAADSVAETLRQHRNDAVRQINTVAALARLAIKRAAWVHISGDVRNVDAQLPAVAV